jgi:hypothetical protein
MRLLAFVLLFALGLVRGIGGILLLTGKTGLETQRGDTIAGVTLLVVAIVAMAAASGVVRHRPWGVRAGIAACVLFVMGGVLNGFLLFGAPRMAGLVGNLCVAAVIGAVLAPLARGTGSAPQGGGSKMRTVGEGQ